MANINIYGTLVRPVESDKIVNGSQVEGGYFVCSALPSWGAKGQLCYCTNDSKFYQHNGTNWVDARLDGLATRIDALDFTYDDEDESKNKTYFVKTVAQEDGLVAITREQLPDIEISATAATATTLSNGGSFTVLTSIDEVEDTTDTDNGHKILKTTKQFTIPTIEVEQNDNLTLSATTGKITIGHSTALTGNDAATNEVIANSSATLQLKDTDGLKFVKTTYDANGHKNGSTQTEYKMPKITSWTWNSTATQVTATLGGNGITTLNIPNMPFASTTQSGVISATTQSFAGDKTFTGTVTINKDVIVDTNANIKGTATVNDLKVTTASVGTSNVGTANVATLNATTATVTNAQITGTATIKNANITSATATSLNVSDVANVNILNATTATIGVLGVTSIANIATVNATTAFVNQLTATNATLTSGSINALAATSATIANATITNATIATLSATDATVTNATVNSLSATSATINAATITTLGVTATANVNNLTATNATINTLTATTINVATANATTVSASTLTASTASITMVTATNATIGSLQVTGESSFESNVSIAGNLSVKGTTTSVDFETAVAKENIIVTNSENTELAANIGGIAMMTGKTATDGKSIAYGVMYDSTDDLIKLGQGRVTNDNNDYEFTFDEGEKEIIATREWVNEISAPIAHASTATTYGVASTTHYGHVKSATASPSAHNAAASVGSKTDVYAREDHVHPVSLITFNNTGNGAASGATYNTSAAVTISHNTIGAAQKNHASTTSDFGLSSTTNYGHAKASATTPKAHAATGSAGTAVTVFALEDHVHPVSALTINFATATTGNTSATTTFNTSAATTVTIGPASIGVSPGATKVEISTTNGNIKIDNVEKTVYTHPGYTAATQAKVYNITVDSKGHINSASTADAGDLLMTGYTATAASIATTDSVLTAIGKLEQYVNDKNDALTTALQNYVDAIDALVGGN